MFDAYATNSLIGSPSAMYDLLLKAAVQRPIAGNQDGSYLTLKSNLGLIFGVIQLCSGSGTVFLDQAYWQRAIASRPETAVKAYILGGIAWFAIPFGFSTTLGLAAAALTDNPVFPTYPEAPSAHAISSGLAAPYAAIALLGKSGAAALLVVLFMAVTSCASAELIAVSSLLTFDVYKAYIKPAATPEQLIRVSHMMICVFGLAMAVFACIWNAASIDLGWLFLYVLPSVSPEPSLLLLPSFTDRLPHSVMGILIGGAVFPTAFAIVWKKQSRSAAISGCLSGLAAGLIAWLSEAYMYSGEITVASTGTEYATLAGCLASIMTGLIVSVVVTYMRPDDFDWEVTRAINAAPLDGVPEADETASSSPQDTDVEKPAHPNPDSKSPSPSPPPTGLTAPPTPPSSPASLKRAFTLAVISSFLLTIILDLLIPLPMFFTGYIFSKGFFTAWVIISFIWVFASAAISCFLPLWEVRDFWGVLFRGRGKTAS